MNLDIGVLDSTKINAYIECPRKFLFRHIAGWTPAIEKYDLVFGRAWHKAMSYLLENGYSADAVRGAYDEFSATLGDIDDSQYAKNRAEVLNGLVKYIQEYGDEKVKPIHVEVGGTVAISEENSLFFKLDAILEDELGNIVGYEFKTASRNSEQWRDHWRNSFQILCYLYALHCLYGDKVWGIKVRGSVFTKTKGCEHVSIPIRASIQRLELWLEIANTMVNKIRSEVDELKKAMEQDDTVLRCFLPNFCSYFGGCPYFDYCVAEPNPLRYFMSDYVPPEMKVEFWNPLEHELKKQIDVKGGKYEKC